eukprot:3872450-Pleurochrysis_carterae.AAC.1
MCGDEGCDLEEQYPWMTCTCCGPHMLSLERKDLDKISQTAAIIKNGAMPCPTLCYLLRIWVIIPTSMHVTSSTVYTSHT